MFAPENYVRWVDLAAELHEWSHRILLAYELEEVGEDPSPAFGQETHAYSVRFSSIRRKVDVLLPDQTTARDNHLREIESRKAWRELDFTSSLVANMHLAEILLQFDTLVCSPSGQIMRAPDLMLLHSDRLDWCHLSTPIRKTPEFLNLFDLFDRGVFGGKDIAERFCFIDPLTGLVTLKNNSLATLSVASHIDMEAVDVNKCYGRLVEPFLGHAIAWNSKSFPGEMVNLLDGIGAFESKWKVTELANSGTGAKLGARKRGPKPTGAKDEYYRRYPSEKPNDISFDAIAAELAEAGFPISTRQIQNYERKRTIS